MLSFFRWVLFFIALLVTLMGGALLLGHEMLVAEGPLEKGKNVLIPRGAGPTTMAKILEEEGVISHPRLFRLALMVDPNPKPIKAGEAVVWDNRCLMHQATPWDMTQRRIMWHSRIAGDPASESAQPRP